MPSNLIEVNLPVVKQEIGDTWIHGVSSDPLKLARYREVARLRQTWLAQQKFQIGDATDLALLRHILLEAEHTWGTDTKTWLDFDHYTPQRSRSDAGHQKLQGGASTAGRKSARISSMESPRCLLHCVTRPGRHRALELNAGAPHLSHPIQSADKKWRHRISSLRWIREPERSAACATRDPGANGHRRSPSRALLLPDTFSAGLRSNFSPNIVISQSGLGLEGFRQAEHRALRRGAP